VKSIALCVYTDDPSYVMQNFGPRFDTFFDYNPNKLQALKNVSVKKRIVELEQHAEYELCVAYNPTEAEFGDMIIGEARNDTIHYAYGYFKPKRYLMGGNPSFFYAKSLEFDRACEFVDNFKNIANTKEKTIEEKFIFHIRSMFMKDECVNYENRSLFIRSAEID
jgi:hypothetical protein